jgi:hypothetical protein
MSNSPPRRARRQLNRRRPRSGSTGRRSATIAPVAFAILSALAPKTGSATSSTIVVTTTAPGIAPDGLCSLSEAIENANAAAAPRADCAAGGTTNVVELAPQSSYLLVLPHNGTDDGTGLPVVVSAITINGHGATVGRSTAPGTPPFRVLLVGTAGTLVLNDLTIDNGFANADGTGLGGGGILNLGRTTLVGTSLTRNRSGTEGGGLNNLKGTVTIQNGTIENNTALNGGGGLRNGGGTVTLVDSVVRGNESTGTSDIARGGGLANHAYPTDATLSVTGGTIEDNSTHGIGGAGIDNAAVTDRVATLQVTGATIRNNRANGGDHTEGLGGGIQNSLFRGVVQATARVTLTRTVLTGNTAVNGGGISSGLDVPGTYLLDLALSQGEISGNTAAGNGFQMGNGGGLYLVNGSTSVANTTLSGNVASGKGSDVSGLGGGVMNAGLSGGTGSLVLSAVTLASNRASNRGGGLFMAPFDGHANARFQGTLVASNTAPVGAGCAAFAGAIISDGSNLEWGNSCQLTSATDRVNLNPRLGLLLANGGPTRTHALLPGSPAIDTGDGDACDSAPIGGIDQRGTVRPFGATCDIGAYEARWAPTTLALDTLFLLSNGASGTGRFTLLSDSRFVDLSGLGGTWLVQPPATLVLVYDPSSACRGLWLGSFTTPSQVQGKQYCLDGSGIVGAWRGAVASIP